MEENILVTFCDGTTKEYPIGTQLYEISKDRQDYYIASIVAAKLDNDVVDLSQEIRKDCTVDFFTVKDVTGNRIYSRGLIYLFILAVKEVFHKDTKVKVDYSIDKGIYCTIPFEKLDQLKIQEIKIKMHSIIGKNLLFKKVNLSRLEVIKYFESVGQLDKVKSLRYISNTYVNMYRLDYLYDYFGGEMPYSTGVLTDFDVVFINKHGVVLMMPNIYEDGFELKYVHHRKLFNEFNEYGKWGEVMKITNAAELNETVSHSKIRELILLAEATQDNRLLNIASIIYSKIDQVKVVLIAGPSSSGKTTTAKKLAMFLRGCGLTPHTLSVDDYFFNREDTPVDEHGELDYESLNAIDLKLFNEQLTKLLAGEEVNVPEFNFILGKKEFKERHLQLGKDDILIIEGLHCLNEELTSAVPRDKKFKIYISPLTQINIDDHNRVPTTDTRLLRRMVRDNRTRGYDAARTLDAWRKVRSGEEKYIFPYQDEADIMYNTSLIYEIGLLKTYVEPLLFSVEPDDPQYAEAIRLINFLRYFLPIPADDVPQDSILREFIGKSCFE